jgi:Bacteriophage lambda head decoration protein D
MPSINEPLNLGDLLKFEEHSLNYSRDQATVAAGQTLELGAIVARETASAKLKRWEPAATDGTELAVGVLLAPCDASLIDRDDALLLARHAVVAATAVVWPLRTTDEQKQVATAGLEARGILIRQSA